METQTIKTVLVSAPALPIPSLGLNKKNKISKKSRAAKIKGVIKRLSWSILQANINCFLFYKMLQIKLEEIFISAKAAAGGFTEIVAGKIEKIGATMELFADIFSFTPLIGGPLSSLMKWCYEKIVKRADDQRQEQLVTHISKFAGVKELSALADDTARQLTYWYAPQLRLFAAPATITCFRLTQHNHYRCSLDNEDSKPAIAQQMAALMLVWLYDALENYRFNPQRPLSTQLVEIITLEHARAKPASSPLSNMLTGGHMNHFKKKLMRWLNSLYINTQQQQNLFLPHFITQSGIQTANGELYGNHTTNPALYGYCYGTTEIAKARGLRKIGETVERIKTFYN